MSNTLKILYTPPIGSRHIPSRPHPLHSLLRRAPYTRILGQMVCFHALQSSSYRQIYIYKFMAGMAEEAVALSDDIDWNVGQRYCCGARMCCLMKHLLFGLVLKRLGAAFV